MKHSIHFIPLAALAVTCAVPARAEVYLTVAQAQAILFPGAALSPVTVTLTDEQAAAIEADSGVSVRSRQVRAFKASTGGWMIVDEVLGKHEFIPIAVAFDRKGAVQGVEILEYRESYGDGVRDPGWRAQFTGKRRGATLKLDGDIRNISGATLSSRHITDGVKRLLSTHAIALSSG
jgi:Na+-translocating ferredoxin:NAD+ oxidoreductase RnfG subunit